MRYIADSNGRLLQVSFGALMACNGKSCTEYTGAVPSGYDSLSAWYLAEADTLYRWKIVSGTLTLDSSATDPGLGLDVGVETLTGECYLGKRVYTKIVDCGALPNTGTKTVDLGSISASNMLRVHGTAYATGKSYALPYIYDAANQIHISANAGVVVLYTTANFSSLKAYAQIWYTKD